MSHDIGSRLDVGGDGGCPCAVGVVKHAHVGPDAGCVDRVLGEFEEFKFVDVDGVDGAGVGRHPGGDGAFVAVEPAGPGGR